MQVLTANQVSQLQVTFNAMGEALEIIDYTACHALDRLLCIVTSDKAISAYRFTGKAIYHSIMLVCACAFYSGVLTRELWNRFTVWADAYVEQCQKPVEQVEAAPVVPDPWEGEAEPAIATPVTVTPIAPWSVSPVLLLPPAKIEPSVEAPKKKRGRPRKNKAA